MATLKIEPGSENQREGKNVETTQAKIRNQLSPYWFLADMIVTFDEVSEAQKPDIWKLILKSAKKVNESKDKLLKLVDDTYDINAIFSPKIYGYCKRFEDQCNHLIINENLRICSSPDKCSAKTNK